MVPKRPSELIQKRSQQSEEIDHPYEEEGESSYDEEYYEDDFQDFLEEMVQEQAENDADRDDDPNFDESESTAYNSIISEENKEGARKQDTGLE